MTPDLVALRLPDRDLRIVDGLVVTSAGVSYPTRIAVIRLAGGGPLAPYS